MEAKLRSSWLWGFERTHKHILDMLCKDRITLSPNVYEDGGTSWLSKRYQALCSQSALVLSYTKWCLCAFSLNGHQRTTVYHGNQQMYVIKGRCSHKHFVALHFFQFLFHLVLTKIDMCSFNSFTGLGEIDIWLKSICTRSCIWCRNCSAVWTLTSHDWMQWMCWGSGYHFIIPVQTMRWKTKHIRNSWATQSQEMDNHCVCHGKQYDSQSQNYF